MNDFFNEKLGILYLPIDVFVRILKSVNDSHFGGYSLEFPELVWDGIVVIPKQSLTLGKVMNNNKALIEIARYSRIVVNYIMVISVLNLLRDKLKEILEK